MAYYNADQYPDLANTNRVSEQNRENEEVRREGGMGKGEKLISGGGRWSRAVRVVCVCVRERERERERERSVFHA